MASFHIASEPRETSAPSALFPESPRPWTALDVLLLVAVVVAFCRPLFLHLDRTDFDNDEAIYAYSVDRMLETGDWATPREARWDGPAFDKPPLMMWLAATGIRLGLFQHAEAAMRFWMALLGAAALVYVFLLGRRFVHPVAGFGAVVFLFVQPAFLFNHGLRIFGMDAALVLAYCGFGYHVLAWSQAEVERPRHRHPLAAMTFFGLGFFSKFVAAGFLPLIFLTAVAALPTWRRRLRETWRTWAIAAGVTLAWLLPWFLVEIAIHGPRFWQQIFAVMVVQRLTGVLDPSHLHPWWFYAAETWEGWRRDRILALSVAGLALWSWEVLRRRSPAAVFVWIWLFLPFVLMSAMTSKLVHYLHPERPAAALMAAYPLALLGVGLGRVVDALRTASGSRLIPWWTGPGAVLDRAGVRRTLEILAGLAFLSAMATLAWGPLRFDLGPIGFKSSSVTRPLALALGFLGLARPPHIRALLPLVPALLLLPWARCGFAFQWLDIRRDPLRATVACVEEIAPPDVDVALTAVLPPHTGLTYDWYYYFRRLGPVSHPRPRGAYERLYLRLFVPGFEAPATMSEDLYRDFLASLDDPVLQQRIKKLAQKRGLASRLPRPLDAVTPPATVYGTVTLLLLPGPYAECAPLAVAHGAPSFASSPLAEPRLAARAADSASGATAAR